MPHEDQFITDPEHWSVMVPELAVRDLDASLAFYVDTLGFQVKFARPENRVAYIEMGHAQIMLDEMPDDLEDGWFTGPMQYPFGRGINFQIEVADVYALHVRTESHKLTLFDPLREAWYRQDDIENGQAEFLLQDPDGYLLRFMQHLGERPVK
ncbi:MAG: VOC family protein [Pseudomonadota bacterium]